MFQTNRPLGHLTHPEPCPSLSFSSCLLFLEDLPPHSSLGRHRLLSLQRAEYQFCLLNKVCPITSAVRDLSLHELPEPFNLAPNLPHVYLPKSFLPVCTVLLLPFLIIPIVWSRFPYRKWWESSCKSNGHRFNSWSAHMPGLQANSPVEGVRQATNWCFSPSLSPSLPLSLKLTVFFF